MNLIANLSFVLAQSTQSSGGGGGGDMSIWRSPMFPLMLGVVVLFIIMSRSKRSQDKQRQQMLGEMKRGDRIQTIGGMLGKVVDVETDRILVKVDESSNTKIWFTRGAIQRVIPEGKTEAAK